MRNPITVLLCLFAISLLTLLSSCSGDNGTAAPNGPVISTPRQFNNLEFTLSTPKATYIIGEQVPLTFSVKNVGGQPITVGFSSGKEMDVKISQGSILIWQQSHVSNYSGDQPSFSLLPGETKTYTALWDQTDLQHHQTPLNTYSLKVWFTPAVVNSIALSDQDAEATLNANLIQLIIQNK